MARIQILELPSEEVGNVSVTPFVLIIDQIEADIEGDLLVNGEAFREQCGARAILVTESTIDLPGFTADEIATINRSHIGTATVDVVPDLTGFEAAITAAIQRAQDAIVKAVAPPEVVVSPEFAAHRARRFEEFLSAPQPDSDGKP